MTCGTEASKDRPGLVAKNYVDGKQSDRWLNIAMSIYLGLVVVALFLLVLWVLSQFNPLA